MTRAPSLPLTAVPVKVYVFPPAVLLFGPKILALLLRLWSTRASRRFGGRLAVLASFVF